MVKLGGHTSSPPMPGSAAATQRRDRCGRFIAGGGNPDRGRSTKPGRTGPTHIARKSKLVLARELTRLLSDVDALSAQAEGRRAESRIRVAPANMSRIRAAQAAESNRRRDLLNEILEDFALDRKEDAVPDLRNPRPKAPRPRDLAREMSRRLGKPFSPSQLYRAHYVDLWKEGADHFGRSEEDGAHGATDRMRLSKRLIVERILESRREIKRLRTERTAALLEESAEQDGWTRLSVGGWEESA